MTSKLKKFRFVAANFAGSFLLFLVQPTIARMVLPRLGGASAVWNSAMLVYQLLLLGGYSYVHRTIGASNAGCVADRFPGLHLAAFADRSHQRQSSGRCQCVAVGPVVPDCIDRTSVPGRVDTSAVHPTMVRIDRPWRSLSALCSVQHEKIWRPDSASTDSRAVDRLVIEFQNHSFPGNTQRASEVGGASG